jgi:hypothetical protein
MIKVDINKAKNIAHNIRRQQRSKEFAPLDDLIAKQIPGWEGAEVQRQAIRDKYATLQDDIDSAGDVAALNSVLVRL